VNALGYDPVPGDPDEVRRIAKVLGGIADNAELANRTLSRMATGRTSTGRAQRVQEPTECCCDFLPSPNGIIVVGKAVPLVDRKRVIIGHRKTCGSIIHGAPHGFTSPELSDVPFLVQVPTFGLASEYSNVVDVAVYDIEAVAVVSCRVYDGFAIRAPLDVPVLIEAIAAKLRPYVGLVGKIVDADADWKHEICGHETSTALNVEINRLLSNNAWVGYCNRAFRHGGRA
jgi:hypothetical protein